MRVIPVSVVTPARGCDCTVCPFFVDNPRAVEPVCSGTNTDCSYCGCARTADRATPDCGECPIRCGSRIDIAAWMADIGGTVTFDDVTLSAQRWPDRLPRFIPQLDTAHVAGLDASLHWPAYAIGLRRVFSPRTATVLPSFAARPARDALGLATDQAAVLVGYGEDPLVEAFWSQRHRLYPQLAAQRWDLMLAPNYSMYGNQPRAEHLINFRRNLMIAEELCGAGVNAAPNLYWFRLEDLERYGRWMADVAPPAVAVNLQTFRTDTDWNDMARPGLAWLATTMPAATRLVIVGTSRRLRLAELAEMFGDRLTVIAQNPVQYARHGAVMGPAGREDVHAAVDVAFAATVRFYARVLDDAEARR